MYGKSCLAVSLEGRMGDFISRVMLQLIDNPAGQELIDAAEAFEHMTTDSMGQGQIIYFPGVPFADGDSDEDT